MGRIVFLVDMNAFFISCEASRNPHLMEIPSAVAGDPAKRAGIVLAANYEARKYGVKTAMPIHEAKTLCKNIVFVSPNFKLYQEKSDQVMQILSRYSPVIQQNSIDEAWMDLTGCESLFGTPVEIANRIISDITNELNLWCSIGISENKFLSKMASEIRKPLGVTEVWKKDVEEIIWPMPVRNMYGIGKHIEKKLYNLGMCTIGDIAKCDEKILISTLGKYGYRLYQLANGIDNTGFEIKKNCKSISHSTTLSKDSYDCEYIKKALFQLTEKVSNRARKINLRGSTVSIAIKYSNFHTVTRQKTVYYTYLTQEIYQAAENLLIQNCNFELGVRLIGVGLGNLESAEAHQMSIFDLVSSEQNNYLSLNSCYSGTDSQTLGLGIIQDSKKHKLDKTIDSIRKKYGWNKIRRG